MSPLLAHRAETAARARRPLAACALAAILGACGGSTSSGGGPPQMRVVDVVYQASTQYDVLVNSASVATGMAYGQATALQAAAQNANALVLEPTGTTTQVLSVTFSVASGADYTAFALESSGGLTAVVASQDNSSLASGQARISLVNAFPGQSALDFYLTAPGATLPASPSLSAVTYPGASSSSGSGSGSSSSSGSGSGPSTSVSTVAASELDVTAGDYRLRAVATGDATQTVIYDSGPITLAAGADLLLAVLQTSGSAAAFTLMSLDDAGDVVWIPDQRVQLRMGNFAPALGSVDTFLDPAGTANGSSTLFASGLSLGSVSAYQDALPGSYELSFAPTGQTQPLVQAAGSLGASTAASVFAIGLSGQASPANLQLLVLTDDLTAPASGYGKLRVVQAAPDLAAQDVVLLDSTGAISQRIVPSLAFGGSSSYLALAAQTYTIALVPTGLDQPLLPSSSGVSVDLTAGSIVTLVVDGCQNPGAGICGGASASVQIVPLADN
jgi:hypothetical protein